MKAVIALTLIKTTQSGAGDSAADWSYNIRKHLWQPWTRSDGHAVDFNREMC